MSTYRMKADAHQVIVERHGINKKTQAETWTAISYHSRFEDAAAWILERATRDRLEDGGGWQAVIEAIKAARADVLAMLAEEKR